MKKENKVMKFASFVLLITIIALILVAGTYAKYTSEATGSSTATVAKWLIKLNGKDITLSGSNENLTFNLFDTINDTATGKAENDVSPRMIAPGTMGSFSFDLENDSQVNAEYTIELTLTDDNNEAITLPLQFSLDGKAWGDLKNLAGNLVMDDTTTEADEGKTTATVQWKWDYERTGKDEEDTGLGIAASNVNVNVKLVVSQVD